MSNKLSIFHSATFIRRQKYSTSTLISKVLNDPSLALEYDKLKSSASSQFEKLVTRIEVQLTNKWTSAKEELKNLEKKAMSEDKEEIAVVPKDEERYHQAKNIMTIIEKLKRKFDLVLD